MAARAEHSIDIDLCAKATERLWDTHLFANLTRIQNL